MARDWTDIKVIEYYASLWEIYHGLLTERQSKALYAFIFEDLSLAEIAEALNISRQAVHEQVQKAAAALEEYEKTLSLKNKTDFIRKSLEEIKKLENLTSVKTAIEKLQGNLDAFR